MMQPITIDDLYEAYYDCRASKRNKRSALQFEMNYERELMVLYDELVNKTYEIGTSITFCVTRPKLREVFAADFRDRIVHHLIMLKFMPLFESYMCDDSYNCRKGKGTDYGIRRLREGMERVSNDYKREAWVLKIDIKGFFMSIDKDVLWELIEHIIRDNYHDDNVEWWLWVIRKVVYHEPEKNCVRRGNLHLWDSLPHNKSLFYADGIPIGNLSSQIFANLLLSVYDDWAMEYLGKDAFYGRYVDDAVACSTDKGRLLSFVEESRRFLNERLHLSLHPDKMYLQEIKKGVKFIGTVIKPHRTYVGSRTVGNAYKVVEEFNQLDVSDINVSEGKRRQLKQFVQRLNSYFGFMVHHNTYAIRREIYKSIDEDVCRCLVMNGRMRYLSVRRRYL